jgi:hypothetical protein
VDGDGGAQQVGHQAGQLVGPAELRVVGADHHELVARQPRRRAADGQLALQPAGQGEQQVVAGLVAQRGVDAREVVEVAADDGDAVAARAGQQGVHQAREAARLGRRVSSSTVPALRSSSAARRRSPMSVQTTSQNHVPLSAVDTDTATSHHTVVPSARSSGAASTR